MIVQPKVRGFICTTAHPAGCAENVRIQAEVARKSPLDGSKRVLVVGSSTGYGLACRITAAFGCGADTVGVFFERPASGSRTATAGWYNNKTFEEMARVEGRMALSVNGDAFSAQVKQQTIDAIKQLPGGQVDLVIYSLAAPRRTDPASGEVYNSVIKPVGEAFSGKTVNFHTGEVSDAQVEPATPEEVQGTVKVMGGEDWLLWMQALKNADVLAHGAGTIAFSYIGPEQTHAIYKDGTIGQAKADLEKRGRAIDTLLAPLAGKAFVSVNKALVTQASAAIPVVPLYITLLYRVMKDQGTHEGCIEQMVRMFARIYADGAKVGWSSVPVDEAGRIRLDDWEMEPEIQREVMSRWEKVSTETMDELADLEGYQEDFYRLFGFRVPGVNYDTEVEI